MTVHGRNIDDIIVCTVQEFGINICTKKFKLPARWLFYSVKVLDCLPIPTMYDHQFRINRLISITKFVREKFMEKSLDKSHFD